MVSSKTLVAIFLVSIMAVVPWIAASQQASALSAVSVSDGATLTSLNSARWARVWLSTDNTIVYFVDVLNDDLKVVKVNATSGATIANNTYTLGTGGGFAAVSEVFVLSNVNYIAYIQANSTTATNINVKRVVLDNGTVTHSVVGATSCSTAASPITAYVTKNKIYYLDKNNVNNSLCTSKSNLDLTSFANIGNGLSNNVNTVVGNRCVVTTDGSTEATDVAYCVLLGSSASSVIAKFVNGVFTSKGTFSSNTGTDPEAFRAGDLAVFRSTSGGTESTITLTISTDTLNAVAFTTDWKNFNAQNTLLIDSTRSYTNVTQFLATSNSITAYDTSGNVIGLRMPAVTVNNSTASISWFTDSFYRISDTFFATMVTTTTTPKIVGSGVEIAPVTYTENLDTALVANGTIVGNGFVKVVCDANYLMPSGKLFVGNDTDCVKWRVLDTTIATIGREVPYTRTSGLVHTDEYTNYNIHVTSTSGDVSGYAVKISYRGTEVDRNVFDSGANTQVRLLYGQCYDLAFVNILTSAVVSASTICADDVVFKESILSVTLGFTFWTSPWGAFSSWNDTSNVLTTTVRHLPFAYNYTVQIYNKTGGLLVYDNQSSSQEVDSASYNLTAYANDCGIGNYTCANPFKVIIKDDNGNERYATYFDQGSDFLFGLRDKFSIVQYNGWGILLFIPIIFAAMFTRNSAGIGGAMTVTVIGLLVFFGVLDPAVFSPVIIGVMFFVAIVGLLAYRILYS